MSKHERVRLARGHTLADVLDQPALSIDDVGLRLGGRPVLQGLSVRAGHGEITAVLGPNGAGKTTMIRCCTGLLDPDSGRIEVLGRAPREACAQGLVGVMPQSTGAWSGIKPVELLRYLASLYRDPLPVDELAQQLGITRFAGTPYRRLSGGQQQAVNLAGALVGRPRLVFLDEPTAGMDPHARHAVWLLLEQLRAADVAILLTTHAMNEAETLADRIWIVDHGRVKISGTVPELTREHSLEEVFLANTEAQGA